MARRSAQEPAKADNLPKYVDYRALSEELSQYMTEQGLDASRIANHCNFGYRVEDNEAVIQKALGGKGGLKRTELDKLSEVIGKPIPYTTTPPVKAQPRQFSKRTLKPEGGRAIGGTPTPESD